MIHWLHKRRRKPPEPVRATACPSCGAPIERNADLGYETCSMMGPRHFWRWFTPQAMERAA